MKNPKTFFLFLIATTIAHTAAVAGPPQIKAYKEAYEGEKPKCIHCHTTEKPKKDGDHELNEYGKKAKELATAAGRQTPEAADYIQAGKIQEE